jgi:hypothetical protein
MKCSNKSCINESKTTTFNINIPSLDWLELLERDFDKAFSDLDILLGEIDAEQVWFSLMVMFYSNSGRCHFRMPSQTYYYQWDFRTICAQSTDNA